MKYSSRRPAPVLNRMKPSNTFPLSPTAFPGSSGTSSAESSNKMGLQPMFPDARRDAFISSANKSTLSTRSSRDGSHHYHRPPNASSANSPILGESRHSSADYIRRNNNNIRDTDYGDYERKSIGPGGRRGEDLAQEVTMRRGIDPPRTTWSQARSSDVPAYPEKGTYRYDDDRQNRDPRSSTYSNRDPYKRQNTRYPHPDVTERRPTFEPERSNSNINEETSSIYSDDDRRYRRQSDESDRWGKESRMPHKKDSRETERLSSYEDDEFRGGDRRKNQYYDPARPQHFFNDDEERRGHSYEHENGSDASVVLDDSNSQYRERRNREDRLLSPLGRRQESEFSPMGPRREYEGRHANKYEPPAPPRSPRSLRFADQMPTLRGRGRTNEFERDQTPPRSHVKGDEDYYGRGRNMSRDSPHGRSKILSPDDYDRFLSRPTPSSLSVDSRFSDYESRQRDPRYYETDKVPNIQSRHQETHKDGYRDEMESRRQETVNTHDGVKSGKRSYSRSRSSLQSPKRNSERDRKKERGRTRDRDSSHERKPRNSSSHDESDRGSSSESDDDTDTTSKMASKEDRYRRSSRDDETSDTSSFRQSRASRDDESGLSNSISKGDRKAERNNSRRKRSRSRDKSKRDPVEFVIEISEAKDEQGKGVTFSPSTDVPPPTASPPPQPVVQHIIQPASQPVMQPPIIQPVMHPETQTAPHHTIHNMQQPHAHNVGMSPYPPQPPVPLQNAAPPPPQPPTRIQSRPPPIQTRAQLSPSPSPVVAETVSQRQNKFAPNQESSKGTESTSVRKNNTQDSDYSQRIAGVTLMKEQSEARNQILREVRQAMEMRDMSNSQEDRKFWDRQINVLNASLKKLVVEQGDDSSEHRFNPSPARQDRTRHRTATATEQPRVPSPQIATIPHVSSSNPPSPAFPPGRPYQYTPSYQGQPFSYQMSSSPFSQSSTPNVNNFSSNSFPQTPLPSVNNNNYVNATQSQASQTASNYTTVKVQTPDDLPGGHQFTIKVNGKALKATVPSGGVKKGDIFAIRIPNDDKQQQQPQQATTPLSVSITPSSSEVVKVRAPTSLPEGYRFTAKMGDRTIVATVPQGGVRKGEIFTVPVSMG